MKLHQLIALVTARKPRVLRAITDIYQKLGSDTAFIGLTREYTPVDEDGERLPPEIKITTNDARSMIEEFSGPLAELIDLVAAQDTSNQVADGTIRLDSNRAISGVPVTTLLYLEKQLVDVRTFISKLPTLSPTKKWTWDAGNGYWVSPPERTLRTAKVPRNHVKAEATEYHPAQVEVYTEDVTRGYWTKVDVSTAIPMTRKKELLDRVNKVIDAVKLAREAANDIDVPSSDASLGNEILSYIFDGEE